MIKYLSLFSGIGAFEEALKNLHIPFELVGYSEIDKYASKAYSAMHGISEDCNLGDISKIDEKTLPNDIDLLTYGFPCQDTSIAGWRKGMIESSGELTRSGLFFEAYRIINYVKPKIAIAENVKNLVQEFNNQFNVVLQCLENAGYNNYWKVLNARDYELPQNRERVIIVSIRTDIDTGIFEFPEPVPLKTRMKDFQESCVDEKYYLSDKMIEYITSNTDWCGSRTAVINKDIASTINTKEGCRRPDSSNYISCQFPDNFDLKTAKIIQVGNWCKSSSRKNPNQGRIYDSTGISPTLGTMAGGNRQPFIIETNPLRIRKLTPLECFRLMGFSDKHFYLARKALIETFYNGKDKANTQLYKMAGNSIVVTMLEFLFCEIFDSENEIWV